TLLARNARVLAVMDDAGTILEGGAVLVEGDRIAGLFDRAAPRPAGIPTLDATGQLVIPGLINTHGHAAMSLLRGLADDLPLMDWLEQNIFPAEAELVAPDFVYWGTLLSSIELLKSGTTTFT
ncbi:MAG: amidohydrolase family protein, partial [Acidobacteria bacterium]|nr:amidohydrolase family protein [Acidobacteriota bacterium]